MEKKYWIKYQERCGSADSYYWETNSCFVTTDDLEFWWTENMGDEYYKLIDVRIL